MFCSTQLSRYELPASLRAGRQGKRRYRGSASPVCPGSHRIRSVPKVFGRRAQRASHADLAEGRVGGHGPALGGMKSFVRGITAVWAIHLSGPDENRPLDAVVLAAWRTKILRLVRSAEYP